MDPHRSDNTGLLSFGPTHPLKEDSLMETPVLGFYWKGLTSNPRLSLLTLTPPLLTC